MKCNFTLCHDFWWLLPYPISPFCGGGYKHMSYDWKTTFSPSRRNAQRWMTWGALPWQWGDHWWQPRHCLYICGLRVLCQYAVFKDLIEPGCTVLLNKKVKWVYLFTATYSLFINISSYNFLWYGSQHLDTSTSTWWETFHLRVDIYIIHTINVNLSHKQGWLS